MSDTKPDFAKLRAERDSATEKVLADIRKTFAEKFITEFEDEGLHE